MDSRDLDPIDAYEASEERRAEKYEPRETNPAQDAAWWRANSEALAAKLDNARTVAAHYRSVAADAQHARDEWQASALKSQREVQRLGVKCEEQTAMLEDASRSLVSLAKGEAFHRERADAAQRECDEARARCEHALNGRLYAETERDALAAELLELRAVARQTRSGSELERSLALSVLVNMLIGPPSPTAPLREGENELPAREVA